MKKLIVVSIAVLFAAGAAEAAPKRRASGGGGGYASPRASAVRSGDLGMAGCGLGSMVIEDNGKWAQVGAAFLNGTGFQTFAISFGTSNCTEDGVAMASRETEAFVEFNLADLRRDLAVGQGEYLSSLSSLYGCSGEKAESFEKALVNDRETLFVDEASIPASLQKAGEAARGCQG
ncbi:MAG: DUF3015 family protein [Bdellovibrionales bacterium]|nr:DUF3015 family protein [Bdellovibrionales bacterium]